MDSIRLDKMLSNLGLGSRSDIKKDIKKGIVTVNGTVIKDEGHKVNYKSDIVIYNGTQVGYKKHVYYLLNKPSGCVTAREDNVHDTVFKYIDDNRKDLSPVGRLDLDTEGLLIITDDGELNHMLMSPAHHVKKTYEAILDRPIPEELVTFFKNGIDIGDEKPTKPADLKIITNETGNVVTHLTISEGRYHQVKRMFEAYERKVVALKRIAIGDLWIDDSLKPGDYRELTLAELEGLKQCVK